MGMWCKEMWCRVRDSTGVFGKRTWYVNSSRDLGVGKHTRSNQVLERFSNQGLCWGTMCELRSLSGISKQDIGRLPILPATP